MEVTLLTSSSSPAERNLYHHAFWAGRNHYIAKMMENHEACSRAFNLIQQPDWAERCQVEGDVFAEALDEVFAQSFQTEAKTKADARSEQAQKAAQAPRTNSLNTRILTILKDDPNISAKGVARILCNEVGEGLIVAVRDDCIEYFDKKGGIKSASIPINDRVSKLKKKIR